ncbi:DUF4129 domain-containing protein [Aquimarina sp. MMG015]|uniref:DUF4129 domain-containing protein n=1 Tax=unclassified Aquimarina TaxID=2627091 RepID=UPI000E4C694C|nr:MULTISPECIES: DUF4129 domain-containing protein [unclassified Aquimarina]AXT54218.1 DUF4129 domain-containing protein [Aquimarina sp. AD1]MBQ4804255.1 DUF4129 domain-containing protein [Aquimarina sp. MMG015]RKN25098.1 DUF4129 domain-containing protein [Aquimarina sp. AD1]
MKQLSYFLLLILIIPFSISAKIQDSISVKQSEEIVYDLDSSKEIREFSSDKIKEYRNEEDFNYTEYEEPDNIWTQFKRWVGQLWGKFLQWIFGVGEVTGFWAVLFKLLPYLVIIGVLFLLGWLFMRVNPRDMLFEKQEAPQIILTEDEDIIQNQNIEQLIQQALKANNYRLAIRYYYLSVLKQLSENEFINWESQKTNTDYLKELTDNSLKNKFQNITRLYDFIWYGSFDINQTSFEQAEQKFKSITNSIRS